MRFSWFSWLMYVYVGCSADSADFDYTISSALDKLRDLCRAMIDGVMICYRNEMLLKLFGTDGQKARRLERCPKCQGMINLGVSCCMCTCPLCLISAKG